MNNDLEKETADKDTEEPTKETTSAAPTQKVPSLYHNYISWAGLAIIAGSITGIIMLLLLEYTSDTESPYLGIFTYILLPGVMIFGIAVLVLGMIFERRRRRRMKPDEIAEFPVLDLNVPRRRRALAAFLIGSFAFLFVSAFGSYRAFEYSESVEFCGEVCHKVMKPEFVAYNHDSHAKIACVECHVGGGAESYVKAKLNGVRQLWGVITDDYSIPVQTPVHQMRPANETCAKCHWANKFYGDQLRTFTHYGYDENNTPTQTRLAIHVGGGDPKTGAATGIHWHMNLGSEIEFFSRDEKRQDVVLVRMKDKNGSVIDYARNGENFSSQQISSFTNRKMDCIDCHSRPSHKYLSPNEALDASLSAKRLDISIPFIKAKSAEALSKTYQTSDEALKTISSFLNDYYKTTYPDIYSAKNTQINAAVIEVQRIYSTYFFPEMKTNWQTHANNIGHYNAEGCFRCHNGTFTSKTGKTIRNDCTICHSTIDQTLNGEKFTAENGEFRHPVNLGNQVRFQCASCHSGNTAFKHPVNLGDISKYSCSECHKGKYDSGLNVPKASVLVN
ncbi:MAG: NapC/NirT family cytochrome c [Pyrinomonadaceae bacterium]